MPSSIHSQTLASRTQQYNNNHKPASPVSDLRERRKSRGEQPWPACDVPKGPTTTKATPLPLFGVFLLPFPHPLRFAYATLRLSPTTAHGSRSPSRKWRARRTASAPQWIPLDLLHASCSAQVLSSRLSPMFCGTWFLLGVWWRPLSATLPTYLPSDLKATQRGRGGYY
jgi:hypothetical protein